MKPKQILFDKDTANLLAKQKNASEFVRQATKAYLSHTSTGGKRNLIQTMVDINLTAQEMREQLDQLSNDMFELREVITKMTAKMGGEPF